MDLKPRFHYKLVEFGLEDDEDVFTVFLSGSDLVPYWKFSFPFKEKEGHTTDESSDAATTSGLRKYDLSQAAER